MIILEKMGKKYFGVKDKVDYVMVYVINIYVEKLKYKRKKNKTNTLTIQQEMRPRRN